jgi:hypothetical protein
MKKPRPSVPDHRPGLDDAESAESAGPIDSTAPDERVDGDASAVPARIEPEEMGGEAPCHLPRFWDVDE